MTYLSQGNTATISVVCLNIAHARPAHWDLGTRTKSQKIPASIMLRFSSGLRLLPPAPGMTGPTDKAEGEVGEVGEMKPRMMMNITMQNMMKNMTVKTSMRLNITEKMKQSKQNMKIMSLRGQLIAPTLNSPPTACSAGSKICQPNTGCQTARRLRQAPKLNYNRLVLASYVCTSRKHTLNIGVRVISLELNCSVNSAEYTVTFVQVP